jgi:hypothetical protein
VTGPSTCWYREPARRPTIGWCPPTCTGPVTHGERAGNGDRLLYCEGHANWRIKTIRLPLVIRLQPNEPSEPSEDTEVGELLEARVA